MHVLFPHPKHIVNLKCKSLPLLFFFFLPPITVPLMRCKICALMTEKLFRSGGELIGFNQGLHPSGYERQQTTSSWCLISCCDEGRARILLAYLTQNVIRIMKLRTGAVYPNKGKKKLRLWWKHDSFCSPQIDLKPQIFLFRVITLVEFNQKKQIIKMERGWSNILFYCQLHIVQFFRALSSLVSSYFSLFKNDFHQQFKK